MKSYINAIVIFNEQGNKRFVDFAEGVNIITGDSKTGKSALVEIIDYCLCSSRCTIPKGKITEFGFLYSLLFVINNKCIVIGREKWERGGKMYFGTENINFSVENLECDYFKNKLPLPPKEVQYLIEQTLGLLVSNMKIVEDKDEKKASLRNMVSYMFQHQNLMASKFALFYRFTDFYKRQDVIEQFPVFAGIIEQEYYSTLIRLNTLKRELKKLQKEENQNGVISVKVRNGLMPLFKDYYALINTSFNEKLTMKELLDLSKKLPDVDLSLYSSKDIVERYDGLNNQLEILRGEESDLLIKIRELKNANNTGVEYIDMLKELKEKTEISTPEIDEYKCPLCGNECKDINRINSDVLEASQWLENEVKIASSYSSDFLEEIRKLEEKKDKVVGMIKEVYGQIKRIEKQYLNTDHLKGLRDKISDAKARINFYVETINEGIFKDVNREMEEVKEKIRLLELKIGNFDVPNKIAHAKYEICTNMNKLAETLDFEDEFRPVNLTFDMATFDLYHFQEQKKQKIFLSEMGSGANWVSCHISLFLSFLHYFAKQKEKSPMPLFLFFDQPSQVYFPQGIKDVPDKDESGNVNTKKKTDIYAVNKVYKTIFIEVENIKKETGILPQVIIADHVDGEELEIRDTFKQHTRRNWRDGRALI
jgi:hypothetical protein